MNRIHAWALWGALILALTGCAPPVGNKGNDNSGSSTVAAPQITPTASSFTAPQTATITSATAGAVLHFTLDGSLPSATHGFLYTGPFTVPSSVTLKAIASKDGASSAVVTKSFTITVSKPQTAAPEFDAAEATYPHPFNVVITSATENALIIYTTEVADPAKNNGTVYYYESPVTISETTTIHAIAYRPGMAPSEISSRTFTLEAQTVNAPKFSPHGGIYYENTPVTLTTSTAGAAIYYTTDGSEPTTSSSLYSSPINVTSKTTIKAFAFKDAVSSAVLAETFLITLPVVETPEFSLVPGSYFGGQTVALTSETEGAAIRYTLDGTDPTSSSALYSAPLAVDETTQIKAKAFKADHTDSEVMDGTFTILSIATPTDAPTFSPDGGTAASFTVTLSSTTPGASIRYTTDGSVPTATSGTLYTTPFSLTSSATVLAVAYKNGLAESNVVSRTFNIQGSVAAPAISPDGGTFDEPVEVTLTTATSGATIRYTLDGTTPTTSHGTVYSGAFELSGTATVKAIASKNGLLTSAVTARTIIVTGDPVIIVD